MAPRFLHWDVGTKAGESGVSEARRVRGPIHMPFFDQLVRLAER